MIIIIAKDIEKNLRFKLILRIRIEEYQYEWRDYKQIDFKLVNKIHASETNLREDIVHREVHRSFYCRIMTYEVSPALKIWLD